MKLKPLIHGIASFARAAPTIQGTGGTTSARYCYSVWLRHLVMAKGSGLNANPKVVAELGPGDSLGIGLAALISGAERCFAFDVVEHANLERNLSIFDELVALFTQREPIPGDAEWPRVRPRLEDYRFPDDLLDQHRLRESLRPERLAAIRESITNVRSRESMIQYKVPWYDAAVLEAESVDMIYSQAVLEHVEDLKNTYRAMSAWIKPTGFISHTIDFKCHGATEEWNGHWAVSDLVWKLIRGRRPYYLNRQPLSTHLALLEAEGFRIVGENRYRTPSNLSARQLARKFRSISEDDLVTSEVFLQGVKILT